MLGVLEKDPSHPFAKIPIHSSPILQELKTNHLTFELNSHVQSTTGICSPISHLHKINLFEECCKDIKTSVLDFKEELKDCVVNVID